MRQHGRRGLGYDNRRGFTLVELLVTITIIGILAGLLLGTLYFSAEKARDTRTRTIIARLSQAITIRWESYRTRRVPIDAGETLTYNANAQATIAYWVGIRAIPEPNPGDPLNNDPPLPAYGGGNPFQSAAVRLMAIRELQRLEMPHRWADVTEDSSMHPASPPANLAYLPDVPALSRSYLQRYNENRDANGNSAAPTDVHQGAECLYLIVTMGGMADDAETSNSFRSADIGDVDQDGMNEFLDGWGNPISFLRWAPGFVSDLQPDADATTVDDPSTATVENLERDAMNNHDPFDPLKTDMPPYAGAPPNRGFRMFPLIYSAGSDGELDTWAVSLAVNYNDPYAVAVGDPSPGEPFDTNNDGLNHLDNIHNHALAGQVR